VFHIAWARKDTIVCKVVEMGRAEPNEFGFYEIVYRQSAFS
jgi:hypothetical protein